MKKLLIILALIVTPVFAFANTIERVSVSSTGVEADGDAPPNTSNNGVSISSDGRWVVFSSGATNLVTGDANAVSDVFVYDRDTDVIERVSVASGGVEGNNHSTSYNSAVSSDGRYITFQSQATNLVPNDLNNRTDIFVYDRTEDTIERVSVSGAGVEANGDSQKPSISSDGRYVTFLSIATNLVAGDINGRQDVFVYDRDTDTIELESLSYLGTQADATIDDFYTSEDARYIVFESGATNLVEGDTNASRDIFLRDRVGSTTERISVNNLGVQGNASSGDPKISHNGRYISFSSGATNLSPDDFSYSVFLYDRDMDELIRVPDESIPEWQETQGESYPLNNGNLALVAYINGDEWYEQVYLYDVAEETFTLISADENGTRGNESSKMVSATPEGLFIAFASKASNLIQSDTNSKYDSFVWIGTPPDTTAPVITILGDNPASVTQGTTYVDAGATATDDTDGDLTGSINVTDGVDTGVIGSYEVVYDVTDAANNTGYATRTVDVVAAPEEPSSGGGSSRKKTVTPASAVPSAPLSNEEAVKSVLEQLILVLQQLIQAFLAQQQN